MQLFYRKKKLRKEFEDARLLAKNRGKVQSDKIQLRLAQLDAVENWSEVVALPGQHHELTHDKAGWISCDLDGQNRLIYEPWPQPAPRRVDGTLDGTAVTAVRILGVLDTHERKNKNPA
jgi:plasmid maintenance system killer protein